MATELYFDIFAVCGPLRENKKVDTLLYLHTSEPEITARELLQ